MKSATYIASVTSVAGLPPGNKPQVAMIGRSNVGKSSLINHLTGRKDLAHVSSNPGRTATINLYEIDKRFYLVDLPGYGYAKASKEQKEVFGEMIEEYLTDAPDLRLVLLIIDARIPPSALDDSMLLFLQEERIPFAIVMNKVDKVKKNDRQKIRLELETAFPDVPCVQHSVENDEGVRAITQLIDEAVKAG
jgi:GTP-binding protein